VLAADGVQSFQLQAHLIGLLTDEGSLHIKNVSNGKWDQTEAYGTGVTQYRLVVSNPMPPHRTTPASYNTGQTRCRAMTGDPDCYYVTGFALPAPYYGVYCGLGRPTGDDFWGVLGNPTKTPIDGLDQMCLHHDLKSYWYAGDPARGVGRRHAQSVGRSQQLLDRHRSVQRLDAREVRRRHGRVTLAVVLATVEGVGSPARRPPR
jgi:hypothetical protein